MQEIVTAGIVTYNPDIGRLKVNIDHAIRQVDYLIVFDNGSDNADEIMDLCNSNRILFLHSESNIGLAGALNQIFHNALNYDSSWVVTLDQDSVLPDDYITKAKRFFSLNDVGIICCGYIEKNLGESVKRAETENEYSYISRCITSGAIVRVEAYLKTEGYDEILFVDYVDFDFSKKIKNSGYRILRMNDIWMEHELGESQWVQIFGHKIRFTKHSAIREYYIARNITIYIDRYKGTDNVVRDYLSLIKHFVFTLLFDKDKNEKLKALLKGSIDGHKYVRKHPDNHI